VNAYLDSNNYKSRQQSRVVLETDLSFSTHVTKSAYYHLKHIRIRRYVPSQDVEKRVHGFITSRVDYCNVLLPKKSVRQLQLIRTRTSEHITPGPYTGFQLHLLVYKSLKGLGPKHIADINLTGSSPSETPSVHTKQGESAFSFQKRSDVRKHYAVHKRKNDMQCIVGTNIPQRLKTHIFLSSLVLLK